MSAEPQNEAAEYVLGTLPADERARFAERLRSDAALAESVRDLQRRLSPLDESAPEERPRAEVWQAIERATARSAGASETATAEIVRLRRRAAFWRGATIATGALAAGLALFVYVDRTALPPPETTGGRYIAVVDSGGREPALIAEVDTTTGVITVRSLTAEAPAGQSLELWHVPEGRAPRSLGILQASFATQTIEDFAAAGPVGGVLAVSVEPEGGSPSGAPTGPVIYSGRLIPIE